MLYRHFTPFVIIALFFYGTLSFATDGKDFTATQVMKKVDSRYDGDTSISDMTMILIDKNGKQRLRALKSYNKDYGPDSKGIIFFLNPADVRHTSYLSWDWELESKEDDSWLYLPALRKVKRIASDDSAGSFMGSDFSYYDINGMEVEDWDYKYLKVEDVIDGQNTWVIEGRPKTERKNKVIKESGYLKTVVWVRKDNFIIVKAKYWVKKGKKIKYFRAKDVRLKSNIWTAFEMTMVTSKQGKKEHSSVIRINDITYNNKIDGTMFTTQRMERGL